MNDREYEDREMKLYYNDLADIESLPVNERKESMAEFIKDCKSGIVAERVGWLLNGSYGYGSCRKAWQIVANNNNPKPSLFYMIASLEWRVGQYYTGQAWKALSKADKDKINADIDNEIKTTDKPFSD